MRAGAERAEVTVEQVVRQLKLLGFSDIRKVVSWRNEVVTRTETEKRRCRACSLHLSVLGNQETVPMLHTFIPPGSIARWCLRELS